MILIMVKLSLVFSLTKNISYLYQSLCFDVLAPHAPFVCIPVCEQAYTMAQNLDPSSEGRGVLQFKTGLASVIKVCFPS
jgi:callose synthase